MRIIYGTPNTIMCIGTTMLGDTATPFFGFIDRSKVVGMKTKARGDEASSMSDQIEALGGTIILFENPDAAMRFDDVLGQLFAQADETPWGDKVEVIGQ